ncbi:MAG: class I SAM-dependent methyltransferase [Planctomycetota bacterium]
MAVAFAGRRHAEAAGRLAYRLGLPRARKFRDPHPLHLMMADDPRAEGDVGHRLELRVVEPGHALAGGRGVAADPLALDTDSAAGRSRRSPIHRAFGLHRRRAGDAPLRVLDATAGLGEDAWLLAAAGGRVTAVERHPVVHALLADGLRRAAERMPDVAARVTLLSPADAAAVLAEPPEPFDAVLLDPMFPGADRRRTLERKPLRVLRMLCGDDADADALLPAALGVARWRVVVKRPKHAPPLAGRPPAAEHAGRGLRFDVYPAAARS